MNGPVCGYYGETVSFCFCCSGVEVFTGVSIPTQSEQAMALNEPRQASVPSIQNPNRGSGSGEMEFELDSQEEVEKLELAVKEMADKILNYRRTLPDQLKEAFALLASDQRLDSSWNEPESVPGTSSGVVRQGSREDSEAAERRVLLQEDKEIVEKIELLKEKTLRNTAKVPVLLKKMKECISKIDNIESMHMTVHPALMLD